MGKANKILEKLRNKSISAGVTQSPSGDIYINLIKYKKYMSEFINQDFNDGIIKQWYSNFRETNTFMAYNEQEFIMTCNVYNAQGFIEYKRLNKIIELSNIGIKASKAELIVYKKRGYYNIFGSTCPMSCCLGYMPADDELCILEIEK